MDRAVVLRDRKRAVVDEIPLFRAEDAFSNEMNVQSTEWVYVRDTLMWKVDADGVVSLPLAVSLVRKILSGGWRN